MVLFYKENNTKITNSEEDVAQFNRAKGNKDLQFQIAEEERFIEQISWADVIFIHGGAPQKQLPIFLSFKKEGLENAFKGKVVGGDSAGTYFLAKYIYSNFKNQIYKGLGLLPIKLICHYTDGAEKNLEHISGNFENIFLREYEYRVIIQSA